MLLHFWLRVATSLPKNKRVALTQKKNFLSFFLLRKEKVEKLEVDNKEAVDKGE